VVGEEHRLGPLQVGVTGHDHTLIASGQINERALYSPQPFGYGGDRLLGVEAQIHGHLVVPRPGGM